MARTSSANILTHAIECHGRVFASFKYARYLQDPVYEFLHDLKNDPDELTNLATDPEHADIEVAPRRTDALVSDYAEALSK